MYNTARALLGSGYVPEYYESAASDFVMVAASHVREARKAMAEEIANAIEAKASDTSYSEPEAVTEHLLAAAQTARQIGGQA
jgi:hypothetical protein